MNTKRKQKGWTEYVHPNPKQPKASQQQVATQQKGGKIYEGKKMFLKKTRE